MFFFLVMNNLISICNMKKIERQLKQVKKLPQGKENDKDKNRSMNVTFMPKACHCSRALGTSSKTTPSNSLFSYPVRHI